MITPWVSVLKLKSPNKKKGADPYSSLWNLQQNKNVKYVTDIITLKLQMPAENRLEVLAQKKAQYCNSKGTVAWEYTYLNLYRFNKEVIFKNIKYYFEILWLKSDFFVEGHVIKIIKADVYFLIMYWPNWNKKWSFHI